MKAPPVFKTGPYRIRGRDQLGPRGRRLHNHRKLIRKTRHRKWGEIEGFDEIDEIGEIGGFEGFEGFEEIKEIGGFGEFGEFGEFEEIGGSGKCSV